MKTTTKKRHLLTKERRRQVQQETVDTPSAASHPTPQVQGDVQTEKEH